MPHRILVDFDGTLAEYEGWSGEFDLGAPKPGAVEAMRELVAAGFKVRVHTVRTNKSGIDRWLIEHGFPGEMQCLHEHKATMSVMIDDRAVGYTGDWEDAVLRTKRLTRGQNQDGDGPSATDNRDGADGEGSSSS